MITVLVYRTTTVGFVDPARAGLVQRTSLDDFTDALDGTLPIGVTKVSSRACRTRLGARLYAWRMRRGGARVSIGLS